MTSRTTFRLHGLESDNLLAFLALIGLLRSLEAVDRDLSNIERFHPRAAWDLDHPPLRPVLHVSGEHSQVELAEAVSKGIGILSRAHDFDGRKTPDYTRTEAEELLTAETRAASVRDRDRVDLFAAVMTDGAIKDPKKGDIQPTPFCLMFGQGWQFFLERLVTVPRQEAPPPKGRGRSRREITATECLIEALFHPWHRSDPTPSFRWDPEEDVRYALMAGDPTDSAYKTGTQHGANRLAAVAFPVLTVVPSGRSKMNSLAVIGGNYNRGFQFAWPIWREPATLATIRSLLAHPALYEPGGLDHLGIEYVLVARRISVGKFMNFSRARPVGMEEAA